MARPRRQILRSAPIGEFAQIDPAAGTGGPSVSRRTLRGLAWALGQNLFARVVGFACQLVLAILLDPGDFGVIGLTFAITAVAATLQNLGLDDVLLQRHRALALWLGAAFWIGVLVSGLTALLIVAAAPVLAGLYGVPELRWLLCILALGLPLSALQAVPALVLRSRLRFDVLAVLGCLEIVAQSALTIILASYAFGAYSFAIPIPVVALAKLALLRRLVPRRPGSRARIGRWKYILPATATVFVSRILISIINQADYIILGLVASKTVVGVYYFAFRLAVQPVWILAGNFNGVILPALIQLKADPARQARAAVRAATLLSYCVMPAAFLVAALSQPFVSGFYGAHWAASIPIMQILSVGVAFDAVSWVAGGLLAARGEFGVTLRHVSAQVPILVGLVTGGALLRDGVGAALGVAAFYVTTQPVYVCAALSRVGVSRREVAAIYVRPTLFAMTGVGAGLVLASPAALADHPVARGCTILAAGLAVYAGLVRWRAPVVWDEAVARLRGAVSRRLAPAA